MIKPLLALAPAFVLAAVAQNMDADQLRKYFAPLQDPVAHEASLQAQVERLGDDSFKARSAANNALRSTPFLPRHLLETAAKSADPEIRLRARQLLDAGSKRTATLNAALEAVARKPVKGLASELLALPLHLKPEQVRVWERAAEATTQTGDDALWQRSLKHPAPPARKIATRLLGPNPTVPDSAIAPLLNDPSEDVQLEAGHALLNREYRPALRHLGHLLLSESFGTRWRALSLLRSATGQTFGYTPDRPKDKRAAAAAKWNDWIAAKAETAKLTLPAQWPTEIALFNGTDLNNWVAVNSQGVDKDKTAWTVKNGIIHCLGKEDGHLRTDQRFKNYRLDLTWRWPEGRGGDSGVFLHLSGDDTRAGRQCIEAQLLSGKAGDFWIIGKATCQIKGRKVGSHSGKFAESSEKKPGEWNQMSITVNEGELEVKVNDVLQNKATDGPKQAAYIGLQVEGDALEFGRVLLTPLD